MTKDQKRSRNETHYTPRELASAIAIEELISVLRDPDSHWLEDSSPHYRRKTLDQIEKLITLLADGAHLDILLPERKYSHD
jgi:hypothetical protein